jgi:hypothetical protein
MDKYTSGYRVHFDDFAKYARRELDPQRVISEGQQQSQKRLNALMEEVKEITRRLGVSEHQALAPATEGALARLSDGTDPARFKAELVKAKEKDLPDLFKEIEAEGKELARWMTAPTIPLRAQSEASNSAIGRIDEKIFHVELYAGLVESVERVKAGKVASYADPICLIQTLRYMDEECLLDYDAGGMDFGRLRDFEDWLCRPHNFERLFPYPRTVAAFRVRRDNKEYDFDSWRSFIRFDHGGWKDANQLTFLYIRNGEQLFRLSTSGDLQIGGSLRSPGTHTRSTLCSTPKMSTTTI